MHLNYEEMFINFGNDKVEDNKLKQYRREVWTDSKCLYIPRIKYEYGQPIDSPMFCSILRKAGADEDKINLLSNVY